MGNTINRAGSTSAPVAPRRPESAPTVATPTRSTAAQSTFEASTVSPAAQKPAPSSVLRFDVNPGMPEIQSFAKQQGWLDKGWNQLSVFSQELIYTTDNWKTTNVLRSFDVPSPFVNGRIQLPNVPPGTNVEFALHIHVASHAPADIAGYRERGDLWLNNGGANYTQVTG